VTLIKDRSKDRLKEDVAAVAIILFVAFIGSIFGYYGRMVSTNDKYILARAEEHMASAAYFNAKELEIMTIAKKEAKERKEATHATRK
jgi:hypothetical protein